MRIGIIGFGYWGKILSRCFSEVPALDVSFIADIAPLKREEARRHFPNALLAASPDELLGRGNMDAVVIATPANTHYGIAKAALEAGRHVWIEKPIAETAAQARALVMLAQERRRVLFVDHTFLYSDSIRLIKEMLVLKDLENVRCYESIRTNKGQCREDTSIFHDLAIHDLAILDFLVGESPLAVSAKKLPTQGAATPGQRIALTYASGMRAGINVNWSASTKARRIVISSNRQAVEFDDMELHHKVRFHERPRPVADEHGLCGVDADRLNGRVLPLHSRRETLANAVECFLRCVRTGERPVSDGWQGVRLAAIVDACMSSAEAGGTWIEAAPPYEMACRQDA
ncbi:Gfo/Idh/MocA family protein [Inquilinus sp. Marseille-Q2685]|uniref:Gfo/Idh/MocA family protein n=1 Tax=Inquilinus sp. Marseille-Q2685 TaxID=2866581 RepID=UPI001CE4B205|nr:Gfo/Idh/MocA family oxidoreductase [Inquilinus sp. Marseille-Q2685]